MSKAGHSSSYKRTEAHPVQLQCLGQPGPTAGGSSSFGCCPSAPTTPSDRSPATPELPALPAVITKGGPKWWLWSRKVPRTTGQIRAEAWRVVFPNQGDLELTGHRWDRPAAHAQGQRLNKDGSLMVAQGHTRIHTHVHTHTCTQVHTHVHTHTYTYSYI